MAMLNIKKTEWSRVHQNLSKYHEFNKRPVVGMSRYRGTETISRCHMTADVSEPMSESKKETKMDLVSSEKDMDQAGLPISAVSESALRNRPRRLKYPTEFLWRPQKVPKPSEWKDVHQRVMFPNPITNRATETVIKEVAQELGISRKELRTSVQNQINEMNPGLNTKYVIGSFFNFKPVNVLPGDEQNLQYEVQIQIVVADSEIENKEVSAIPEDETPGVDDTKVAKENSECIDVPNKAEIPGKNALLNELPDEDQKSSLPNVELEECEEDVARQGKEVDALLQKFLAFDDLSNGTSKEAADVNIVEGGLQQDADDKIGMCKEINNVVEKSDKDVAEKVNTDDTVDIEEIGKDVNKIGTQKGKDEAATEPDKTIELPFKNADTVIDRLVLGDRDDEISEKIVEMGALQQQYVTVDDFEIVEKKSNVTDVPNDNPTRNKCSVNEKLCKDVKVNGVASEELAKSEEINIEDVKLQCESVAVSDTNMIKKIDDISNTYTESLVETMSEDIKSDLADTECEGKNYKVDIQAQVIGNKVLCVIDIEKTNDNPKVCNVVDQGLVDHSVAEIEIADRAVIHEDKVTAGGESEVPEDINASTDILNESESPKSENVLKIQLANKDQKTALSASQSEKVEKSQHKYLTISEVVVAKENNTDADDMAEIIPVIDSVYEEVAVDVLPEDEQNLQSEVQIQIVVVDSGIENRAGILEEDTPAVGEAEVSKENSECTDVPDKGESLDKNALPNELPKEDQNSSLPNVELKECEEEIARQGKNVDKLQHFLAFKEIPNGIPEEVAKVDMEEDKLQQDEYVDNIDMFKEYTKVSERSDENSIELVEAIVEKQSTNNIEDVDLNYECLDINEIGTQKGKYEAAVIEIADEAAVIDELPNKQTDKNQVKKIVDVKDFEEETQNEIETHKHNINVVEVPHFTTINQVMDHETDVNVFLDPTFNNEVKDILKMARDVEKNEGPLDRDLDPCETDMAEQVVSEKSVDKASAHDTSEKSEEPVDQVLYMPELLRDNSTKVVETEVTPNSFKPQRKSNRFLKLIHRLNCFKKKETDENIVTIKPEIAEKMENNTAEKSYPNPSTRPKLGKRIGHCFTRFRQRH